MTRGPFPSGAPLPRRSLPGIMNDPRKPEENERAPLSEKEKREVYSVYVAVIGVVIIIISFFWNIVSLLFGGGE